MASIPSRNDARVLCRVQDVEYMTAKDVFDNLISGKPFIVEEVKINSRATNFDFHVPKGVDITQRKWSVEDEEKIAISLHKALKEVRLNGIGLLNDHGIWAWIGLEVLRDYVVNRWCDGDEKGMPINPERCSYFLTGDGVHAQSRCAVRRLYIAADTSYRACGNYSWVLKFLQNADVYSAIFERRLGMDSELAVAMLDTYLALGPGSRDKYRAATKLVGLILSTTCLEMLDQAEKYDLVERAVSDVSLGLVDVV